LEIFFGVYGIMAIFISIFSNNPVFVPIIGLQTVGFFYIAYMSISHTQFKRNKSSDNHVMTKNEKMAKIVYKLSMIGIVGIILFGGFMAVTGYNTDIYPLDRMRGNFDGIIGSSDPAAIRAHLVAIHADMDIVMENMPQTTNENGDLVSVNPVWMFPTDSTNFLRMQNNVKTMITTVDKISIIPKDSSAYHTGMMDLNDSALQLRINIMDATPYAYVSAPNVLYSTIWIAAILGIFAALKSKQTQLKEVDTGV